VLADADHLAAIVDGAGLGQGPAGIGRDQAVQIEHRGAAVEERGAAATAEGTVVGLGARPAHDVALRVQAESLAVAAGPKCSEVAYRTFCHRKAWKR